MKKLFATILFMSLTCSYGQSIQLFYNDAVVDTDTITIDVQNSGYHYLDLVNTSDQNINLMITREIISLLSTAETYFCFYECLPTSGNKLTNPVSLTAGDTFSHKEDGNYYYFYTNYDPKDQKGISLVKYNFFNYDNATDITSVVLKFNSMSLGIEDKQTAKISLNAYPNPATTKVFIQHDLKNQVSKARLFVSNIMGITVKSIPISSTSDKTQIDISDFAPGIYFYSIEINGKISATKKLIVK